MRLSANKNPKYGTRITDVTTDAVIVGNGEWKRAKRTSVHLSPEQIAEIKRKTASEKDRTMSQIQTKRATMFSSSVNPETTLATRATLGRTEERIYALKIADDKANDDLDEIKHIKSQMVAAEARAGRDLQLLENERIREQKLQEERSWATAMENTRVEQERLYGEREKTLKEQRAAGRSVIKAQIEERKINGILEAERRDREAKALTIQNAKVAEEDRQILVEKRQRKQAFLHDCLQANEMQKTRRLLDRQREKDEAQMVIEYQAQKAVREQQLEQERADQRALKEREISSIRKKQQRALDTQAMRDESSAIRVQQERDEQQRKRDEVELMKTLHLARTVKRDRDEMLAEKRMRLFEEAAFERREHQRVMDANQAAKEKASREWEQKVQRDTEYRQQLGVDCEREWERKRVDPSKKTREGDAHREANAGYIAKIEGLRQQKLDILRAKGVPEKYLVDIQANRFDVK